MAQPSSPSFSRIERIFAFMVAGIIGLSLICFIALMIATAVGMQRADFASGIWPVVATVPYVGLPIGIILIVILLILGIRRRGRDNAADKRR